MAEKFTFTSSYLKMIECFPEYRQLDSYRALVRYALLGEEPQPDDTAFSVFCEAFMPQIDADLRSREAGRSGGRSRKDAQDE